MNTTVWLHKDSFAVTFLDTSSADFASNWVAEIKPGQYTDFVIFGGDGFLGIFLNLLKDHPCAEELLSLPLAIMPGGTQVTAIN